MLHPLTREPLSDPPVWVEGPQAISETSIRIGRAVVAFDDQPYVIEVRLDPIFPMGDWYVHMAEAGSVTTVRYDNPPGHGEIAFTAIGRGPVAWGENSGTPGQDAYDAAFAHHSKGGGSWADGHR